MLALVCFFGAAGAPRVTAQEAATTPTANPPQQNPCPPGSATETRRQRCIPEGLEAPRAHLRKTPLAPLTPGGKFARAARYAFGWKAIPGVAFAAAIEQAADDHADFGQGAAGYGRRFGTAFGDQTIGLFTTQALFPALLKHDPRYYRMAEGGTRRRAWYAFTRLFVTRTDAGERAFNWSAFAGGAATAGIGAAYYPANERTAGDVLGRFGGGLGAQVGLNLLHEFWPDLRRKIFKK